MTDSPAFRDRSTGLVVFGVLHILLGIICVLVVLGAVVGAELAARRGATPLPQSSIAYVIVVDSVVAIYGFVAGVGSLRARRWARAIVLAVSWLWLVGGAVSMLSLIFILPKMKVLVPPSQERMFMTLQIIISAVIYVLIPLACVLFYGRRDVELTCAARDPRPRWTDRVPLRVLALVLLMAFSSLVFLGMLARPVFPLFGTVITGAPAMLVLFVVALLMAWLAVQLYRLKLAAWMTLIALQVLGGAAALVTFARMDVNHYYESLGVATQQTRAMHLEQLFNEPVLWGVMIAAWIGYIAFVVSLRRYFTGGGPRTRADDRVASVSSTV